MSRYRNHAVLGIVGLAILLSGRAISQAEESYEVTLEHNVMVPMRDGVRLATDVYLPAKSGQPLADRLPTVLMRAPYGKGSGAKGNGDARYFARAGYAVVFQDTRGRYDSEGTWHMMVDDGPDGFDTADWIARQNWSNGKIGMIGTSYVGGTQHALAMTKSPHLTTIIPVDAMSNPRYASMRNGGAFELRFWNWIMLNAGRGSRQAHDKASATMLQEMAANRIHYLLQLPLREGTTPLKFAPEYERWVVEAMSRGPADPIWGFNAIVEHPEQYKDIPVYWSAAGTTPGRATRRPTSWH